MQKVKMCITIIGNGKLAKALVLGLTRSGFHSSNILIIRRQNSSSDFTFFTSRGIRVSTNMQECVSSQHIFLTVSPGGSGEIIAEIQKVRFNPDLHYEIISLVSDLSRRDIKKAVGPTDCTIIRATCNTNIAFGKGLICATDDSILFSSLGRVTIELPNWVLRSIVTVGSGNAFDCVALKLCYEVSSGNKTLYNWLCGLRCVLSASSPLTEEYVHIARYLENKTKIFRNEQFRYSRDLAEVRSIVTLRSTVDALLAQGEGITIDDILSLMKTVITEGGCTEKGINLVSSIEEILSFECLDQAFSLVWKRAKLFRKDTKQSIMIALAA